MELLLAVMGLALIVAGAVTLLRARRSRPAGARKLRLVPGSKAVLSRPLGNLGRSASRLRGLGLDSGEIARILGVATGEVELLLASRRTRAVQSR